MKTKQIPLILLFLLILGGGIFWFANKDATAPSGAPNTKTSSSSDTPASKTPSFNKNQYSLTDPASIWVVANKQQPLQPKTYAPTDLVVPNIPLAASTSMEKQVRQVTATALEKMINDAKQAGAQLNLQSGYRSYSFQVSLYNRYVKEQGQSVADTQSARPGYSEHQTGFAADLGSVPHPECDVEECFGSTAEGEWLAANAYKYGFIIRYPQNMQSVTGYIYEPWHIRYVGVDLATEMHNQNVQTLEQFFGLANAPDYN